MFQKIVDLEILGNSLKFKIYFYLERLNPNLGGPFGVRFAAEERGRG